MWDFFLFCRERMWSMFVSHRRKALCLNENISVFGVDRIWFVRRWTIALLWPSDTPWLSFMFLQLGDSVTSSSSLSLSYLFFFFFLLLFYIAVFSLLSSFLPLSRPPSRLHAVWTNKNISSIFLLFRIICDCVLSQRTWQTKWEIRMLWK